MDFLGLGVISVKPKSLLLKGIRCLKKKKQKTPDSHKDLWEAWPQILPETWDLTLGVRPGHTAPIPEM